ncbi:MAG: hypothetical protein COT73_11580, partial [Bdellovibrio sp. CG10_big_fil_rev_8_21_14_0_10_47_8]
MEKFMSSAPFELTNIVVRAGAGAGKTTELTQRVINLARNYFLKHRSYPHFVVTTFTRKATQELRERLLKEALKTEDRGLIEFIRSPSHLHISTIHGVLSLFLSRYGSVVGLNPKVSFVDQKRETGVLKKKLRMLCETDPVFLESFQSLLEIAEFSEILSATKNYFRLKMQFGVASPIGTEELRKLREQQSRELFARMQILATEIRKTKMPDAWLSLASYLEARAVLFSKEEDVHQFWTRTLHDLPSTRKTKDVSEELAALRDEIKEKIESLATWSNSDEFFDLHEQSCGHFQLCADLLSEELRKEKILRGEIMMEDLENLSLSLIREYPQAAESFAGQWNYWLIDEFQDTSPAQVELLRALTGGTPSFVVGDPQQSIYLFRGARSEVFREKEEQVVHSGGSLMSKMKNYRSRPELLMFFNHLFLSLSSQFQEMEPREEVENISSDFVAEMLVTPKDVPDSELKAVLFRCQELLAQGVSPEKICVLTKNNQDLEDLGWMAIEMKVPVQIHSAGRYFDRREVIDALSLLKFLCNPHDNLNFLQVLRSPHFHLTDQEIYENCQKANNSFWLSFPRTNSVLTALQQALVDSQSRGIGAVWSELLVERQYFHFAHAMDPSGRREANLWKLVQMIKMEERRPGFSYLEFLSDLDNAEEETRDAVPVIEPQRIHLMTVHASKGLQFAHVIVPRLGKGMPSPRRIFFQADEMTGQWTLSLPEPDEGKKVGSPFGEKLRETQKNRSGLENDRLLYVALTRAQESVTLIAQDKYEKSSWMARWPLQKVSGEYEFDH